MTDGKQKTPKDIPRSLPFPLRTFDQMANLMIPRREETHCDSCATPGPSPLFNSSRP
jgi:hypothetical protein